MAVETRKICPQCGGRTFWQTKRGKKKCKKCRYEFTPQVVSGIRSTLREWRSVLRWFVLGHSIQTISEESKVPRKRVIKMLTKTREVMAKDVPEVFSGTVEVDETYVGGRKKNKRKSQLIADRKKFGKDSKSGFGTTKQPVFGMLCRSGKVWAEIVDSTKAPHIIPLITKRVKLGTIVCSDTWRAYTGLAAKGYVHRTVKHREKEYVSKSNKHNHINGLEGFWGYLKRKLAAKGGIRRERLHLYLAEYVWRYNHRNLTTSEQVQRLLNLLRDCKFDS